MSDSKQTSFVIRNYIDTKIEVPGGDSKTIPVKVDIDTITGDISNACGPVYACTGSLFVPYDDDGKPDIRYIESKTDLNAVLAGAGHHTVWRSKRAGPVYTQAGDGTALVDPVYPTEILAHMRHEVDQYDSIERVPHWPPRASAYYLRGASDYDVEGADGSTLDEYVDLFCPETKHDRALIKAAIVTPMWGGHPDEQPLFSIISDHGVGSGKSSTAKAIAAPYGGSITTRKGESPYEFAVKLASNPDRRCLLVDNVKGRQSSGRWESLITADEIDIRKLHKGSYMTPNRWVWYLTANIADLSTDLASRTVVIKIGKADHSVNFDDVVREFLQKRGDDLVADILAFLQQAQQCAVPDSEHTRWQSWERAVLCRMRTGRNLIELTKTRRGGVDGDTSDARDARHVIETVLSAAGFDPRRHRVHVPTAQLAPAFEEALAERMTGRKLWDHLQPLLRTGPLQHCSKGRKRIGPKKTNRGLLWDPPSAQGEWRKWSDGPPRNAGSENIIGFPSSSSPDSGPLLDHNGDQGASTTSTTKPEEAKPEEPDADLLPGGITMTELEGLIED